MTAKQYLNRVKNQKYVLEQAERELSELRGDILSIKAAGLGEHVSGTKSTDLSDKYIKLEEYETKVTTEWDKLITMRMDAKAMIMALQDDRQQAVLYARYINGLGWEAIAREMHYSWKGIFKLHGRALKSFERVHGSTLVNDV